MTTGAERPRALMLGVAVVLAAVAAVALFTAYGYPRSSSLLPRIVGWILLMLLVVEVFAQTRAFFGSRSGRSAPSRTAATTTLRALWRDLKGPAGVTFLLAGVYVTGFMIALPIYIFASLRMVAHKTLYQSLVVSILTTVSVYLVFVVLLDYGLYGGLLFEG